MKKTFLFVMFAAMGSYLCAENFTVKSPNSQLSVNVETGKNTTYSVVFKGKTIINPSPISMTFDNGIVIGRNMKVVNVENFSEDKTIIPVVRQKSDKIQDTYNEMVLNG